MLIIKLYFVNLFVHITNAATPQQCQAALSLSGPPQARGGSQGKYQEAQG